MLSHGCWMPGAAQDKQRPATIWDHELYLHLWRPAACYPGQRPTTIRDYQIYLHPWKLVVARVNQLYLQA